MPRKALVTGATGQTGSYLVELLLSKGYDVSVLVRRTSGEANLHRIQHLTGRIRVASGDLHDQTSLMHVLSWSQPDEVYNLGAQSFVPASFTQPVLTAEVTALGVVRLLEAIRQVCPKARFYQASSSEMFGKVLETPQRETTPFYPRSPYGVSKVFGHYITVNYREAAKLFACSGICFNHECVTAETPVIIRRDGLTDIVPIEDVVPHRTNPKYASRYTTEPNQENRFEVWDANGWAAVTCLTATWNGFERKPNKTVHRIAARGALFQATSDHVVFTSHNGQTREKPAGKVEAGQSLALIGLPEPTNQISMTEDESWLLGLLAAEGYVSEEGNGQVTNKDVRLLDQAAACWRRVSGGRSTRRTHHSGFPGGGDVYQLYLRGARAYLRFLRESLYTRSGDKRIPQRVLNAGLEARLAFLRGFNAGDGLKSTPCTYEFQGFKTSSAALAAGLYWLTLTTLRQRAILCPEDREGKLYYQINLNSPEAVTGQGQHLRRPLEQVVKAKRIDYCGWLFDLATTTGTFHAGIGHGWIHNSPRRGLEFVTRKITHGVAKIKHGLADELRLGNLDAKRDWGFAGDYAEAMWLMLQQDEPEDYVIGTGEARSVRQLCQIAFAVAELDWEKYVRVDPAFYRPAEVDVLLADPSKIRDKLGWRPKVSFESLVESMVQSDLELVGRQCRDLYA